MPEATSDALAERVLNATLGAVDVLSIYLGDRLGYYTALSSGESLKPADLAVRTATNERYAREWLEQQAVTGFVDVKDGDGDRLFSLTAAAEVFADRDSLNYMAPIARLIVSATAPLPDLLDAYRTGGGVPWSRYGADAREGQAAVNKPIFLKLMADWLNRVPDVVERLRSRPPARIADVGCGAGWSTIAIAQRLGIELDGIDVDEPSIELARENLKGSGVEDLVHFYATDAAAPALQGRYDFVTVFEALHDMSRPVEVLRNVRGLLADEGSVLVVDENVAEEFTAPGDEIERLMYGWSILMCLPAGKSEEPSAETGTVMRPAKLREYAEAAGFSDVEVVELDHPFFRLYRLRP
jgi:2-polyprenyl-3-methyl-5-hydroxy-6-metoxy-1,4-benzoquinol methylase